ncbi:MAG: PIN domain-containing protein [Actinobacteria bacterium]|nr:PIN domain-containing protein [Actinomycetota bacterium]MCL5986381.1 PIN domain-containing protein [Actinomycetota bacterium]
MTNISMMNPRNKIFVDTSALLPLSDKSDGDHIKMSNIFKEITKNSVELIITDHVFSEILTLIKRKMNSYHAIKMGDLIRQSEIIEVYSPSNTDKELAWDIFKKYSDQDFSYTDCISFAVMKNLKIKEVLTLDKDFSIFGFELLS